MNSEPIFEVSHDLKLLIDQEMENEYCMNLISLCSEDGFNIYNKTRSMLSVESDKVIAIASSLSALSNSASQEILNNNLTLIIVESENGNLIFLNTSYCEVDSVLTFASSKSLSIAQVRFIAKRLADKIREL